MPKAKAAPPKRKPAKSRVRLYCSLQSSLRYDTYCKRLSLLLSSFPTPLLLSLPETLSHTRAHSIRVCGSGQGVPSYWNSKLFLNDFSFGGLHLPCLSLLPSLPAFTLFLCNPALFSRRPVRPTRFCVSCVAVLSHLPYSACLALPSCPTYPTLRALCRRSFKCPTRRHHYATTKDCCIRVPHKCPLARLTNDFLFFPY